MATGEYICFADPDDKLMEDYVSYLLDLAISNNSDIAITKEISTTFDKNQSKKDYIEEFTPEKAVIDILLYSIPIGVYCKIFKRDFLEKNKIKFIQELFMGEGFNFNIMAFQRANKVMVGHKRIYFYRRNNPNSAITKFKIEKWQNAIYAIDIINKKLEIKTKEVSKAWDFANWHTHCDAFNAIVMAGAEKENQKLYKEYLSITRKNAKTALFVPIKFKEKIRAIIVMIYPKLLPNLIRLRNKKYFK